MNDEESTKPIELGNGWVEIVRKVTEGHIGAMRVCGDLFCVAAKFDFGGSLGLKQIFLSIGTAGFTGARLWTLYDKVCERDVEKLIVLLRARDTSVVSDARLHMECAEPGGIDFEKVRAQMQKRWPTFGLKR